MSAQAITNPVDKAVFAAQADVIEFMRNLDVIAAKYEDNDELMWRRRMALEIHQLREEIKCLKRS